MELERHLKIQNRPETFQILSTFPNNNLKIKVNNLLKVLKSKLLKEKLSMLTKIKHIKITNHLLDFNSTTPSFVTLKNSNKRKKKFVNLQTRLKKRKLNLKKFNFNLNKKNKIKLNKKLIKTSLMKNNLNWLKRKRYQNEITKMKLKRSKHFEILLLNLITISPNSKLHLFKGLRLGFSKDMEFQFLTLTILFLMNKKKTHNHLKCSTKPQETKMLMKMLWHIFKQKRK